MYMRIFPITFSRSVKNNFSTNTLPYKKGTANTAPADLHNSDTFSFRTSDTNFNGKMTQNDLKNLAKNGHIGCLWCGGSMFTKGELDVFLHISQRLASNSNLFSRVMLRFKDYFPQERISLLKQIENYNTIYPNKDLKFIFDKMTPNAEKKLVNKQFFVFHKLKQLKSQLPEETHKEFEILLENSKCRILGIPYISQHSAKEFFYQLSNITKNMPPKANNEILNIANILNHPIFKEKGTRIPEQILKRIYKETKINPHAKNNYISPTDNDGKNKAQILIINKLISIASENKNRDIIKLCEITKKKIKGLPVTLKFSNKAFCYKLHEILNNIDNKELVNKFTEITKQLPTSSENKYAFIVKHKDAPIETIIKNFLEPSKVTLEHITPILRNTTPRQLKERNAKLPKQNKISKGQDNLGNWALAHSWCNCLHGSENIKNEKFPFSREAGQKYFTTLIQDANNGLLSGESVIQMAKNYLSQTGIKINLKGLKYTTD